MSVLDEVVDVVALELAQVEQRVVDFWKSVGFDQGVHASHILSVRSNMEPRAFEEFKVAMKDAIRGPFCDVLRDHLAGWCEEHGHRLTGSSQVEESIPVRQMGNMHTVERIPTRINRTLGVRLYDNVQVDLDPYSGKVTRQARAVDDAPLAKMAFDELVSEIERVRQIDESLRKLGSGANRIPIVQLDPDAEETP